MMITTLLDLLGALLIIFAVTLLIGTYAPSWVAAGACGVMVLVFSLLLDSRKGRGGK